MNDHKDLKNEFPDDEEVAKWSNWLPVIKFSNSDYFCIDLESEKVVFLEHDVMDMNNGLTLAQSFDELINIWSQVKFVEVDDWSEYLDSSGIKPTSDGFKNIKSLTNSAKVVLL